MQLARARREQQLRQLASEGVPLCTFGKSGHWKVGPLHIYTAAGRWLQEETGRRGRLNSQCMSQILEREYYAYMCPDAAARTEAMRELYHQYQDFMRQAAERTAEYTRFMATSSCRKTR